MNNSTIQTGRRRSVNDLVHGHESRLRAREENTHVYEDTDTLIQGLTPEQIQILAQKVYDLLLDELRLETERFGRFR